MILALFVPALSGVLLNEVLYDSSASSDGNNEWIELCYDASSGSVDLSGWVIEAGGTTFGECYEFPSGATIAAGAYLVVGGGVSVDYSSDFGNASSGGLQNGGSESDGVRLLNASGDVVDTLIYDSPDTNGLEDDEGRTTDAPGAADVSAGSSLARITDCGGDTNDSSVDFAEDRSPTPGAANDLGGGDTGGGDDTGGGTGTVTCADSVRINEFATATGGEWVELHNPDRVELAGWTLQFTASSTTFKEATLTGGSDLYLLVTDADASGDSFEGFGNANGALQLWCGGVRRDTVLYGKNDSGFDEDDGYVPTSDEVADDPGSGESAGRSPDGVDTQRSGADFVVFESPTPGAANGEGGPDDTGDPTTADCTGADRVRINEFAVATGGEWVEVYVPAGVTVDLSGWTLAYAKSSSFTEVQITGGSATGEAWIVLGTQTANGGAVAEALDFGNTSGAIELRCGSDRDTVIYGANGGGFTEDDGTVPAEGADAPGDGESAGRVPDGEDTDLSAIDFAVIDPPTPGAANPSCEPGNPDVKINEFIADPASTDDGSEWVELYNAGTEPAVLDGYTLETATSSWGADFSFPAGTTLFPGELVVVGGANVSEADFVADSLSLGNASSSGDGLRLVDCDGQPVDVVLYGSGAAEAELTADGGFVGLAPMDAEVSTGRIDDGADTDDAADWQLFLPATPGELNQSGGDDPGEEPGGGCCGGQKTTRPGLDRPTTAWLAPFGLFGGLFTAAALRRRRPGLRGR